MKAFPVLAIILSLLFISNCDNGSDPDEEDYIHISFRQPKNGDTLKDTTYRIIVDSEQNCGCYSYAEFYIDDKLVYYDDVKVFDYLLDCVDFQGDHTIKVHAAVPNKVETWDSVRVTIDLNR